MKKAPAVPALAAALMLATPFLASCGGGPSQPFDAHAVPSAPDYRKPEAWLALPGRNGLERSAPAGFSVVDEAQAPADVFFIHPTTVKGSEAWNAPWDAPDESAPLNRAVLMGQASVFNGCCRIYAPRYRQASLRGLGDPGAVDLAYADIAAAFREFIARRNGGRPFIIASHSQGTVHAVRLLQEEVLGTPLQDRMVTAYLIGGYVPDAFPELALPLCDSADQTGCVLTWNTSKPGSLAARIVIYRKTYWWRGAMKSEDPAPAVCVNPLTWRVQGDDVEDAATADANPGSMPLPRAPWPSAAARMPELSPHLTGARCHDGMLEVDIPKDAPAEYSDPLTRNFGSYHLNDYGLFYGALRENALRRVQAWRALHAATGPDLSR
jgi:hypothetical protein